jgi:hypothetical protein
VGNFGYSVLQLLVELFPFKTELKAEPQELACARGWPRVFAEILICFVAWGYQEKS